MTDSLGEDFLQQLFAPGLAIKAELANFNGRITCYSGVINSYQSDCLNVTFMDNGQLKQLDTGCDLVLVATCVDEKTVYYFQATVRDLIPLPSLTLNLYNLREIDIRTLRCYFRCEVSLSFLYIDENVFEFEGEIRDLSASGLLGVIAYDSTLKLDAYIEVQFVIPPNPKPIRIPAQIVRITNLSDNLQEIAVRFTRISDAYQDQIIKYLFLCQRKFRKS